MTRPEWVDVFARIARAAPSRDLFGADLVLEMGWLHEAGALIDALPRALTGASTWSDEPLEIAHILQAMGRASLSVGRLFEGHVNTAQLIGIYGLPSLQSRCLQRVRAGGLLGVWGADGPEPLHAEATAGGFVLHGEKIFCSGLGLVGTALVSASFHGRTSLFAVDVGDERRADHSQWRVSGMRATQSGGYDFEGVELAADAIVGAPDTYYLEPYFLGGMYRMCAVQTGGLQALLDGVIASLHRRAKSSAPLSQHRVGSLACSLTIAEAVTERMARRVAEGADPDRIGREAILGREAVERCIVAALEIAERVLGTEAHRETSKVSLVRRDLSFYLRQGAIDERLASVGADYLAAGADTLCR